MNIECILFRSLSFVSFIIKCFCYDSKNKNYNTLKHKFTINAFESRKLYHGHTGSKNKVTNHMIKLAKSSFDNMVSLVFTLRNHFLVKVFYFSRGKSLKIIRLLKSFESSHPRATYFNQFTLSSRAPWTKIRYTRFSKHAALVNK